MATQNHTDEQARLDAALQSDSLLVDSLKAEDRRRKLGRRSILAIALLGFVGLGAWFALSPTGAAAAGESLEQEGWKLWQARQLVEAEAKFEEAVEHSPQSPTAWNGLGWARNNQGKHDEAIEAFQKCLEMAPNFPAALNGLGQSLLSQRNYGEAKVQLLKAAPQAPAAWYGLARVCLLNGEFEEAEKWAQKVANSQPQDRLAQQILAAAKAKELPDSLKSQIEPPDQSQVNVARAWQLMNTGQLIEGKDLFKEVLEKTPENEAAINGLAFAYLNLGEHEQAKPLFQKLVDASDDAYGPMNGLARCLKAEGKVDEAIQLWIKMDEKLGEVNAGTAGLAETYLEQGKFSEAKSYYERLVAAQPGNSYFQQGLERAKAGTKE
ncbi:MAG: tetratricopeptide repeat protein [Planctomycetaceae bacterium]|nr:tetratricopeptide repeat protein [Planctomycetaceae bacterium]